MSILIDTGVLFGASVPSDSYHSRAIAILETITDDGSFCTDHILVEAWLLLQTRVGRPGAMNFLRSISSSQLSIEFVTQLDLERALSIMAAWPDQKFSIIDCTSFAVMERLGCRRAAAFDNDFAIYRTGPNRSIAFEVLS